MVDKKTARGQHVENEAEIRGRVVGRNINLPEPTPEQEQYVRKLEETNVGYNPKVVIRGRSRHSATD